MLIKEFVCCYLLWDGSNSNIWQDHIQLKEYQLDEKGFWGGLMIGKLLLTITVTNLQQLDQQEELVMYTGVFVEI